MAPSVCNRCQRFTKTRMYASEQLCKDCGKSVELQGLPSLRSAQIACPDVELLGRVDCTQGSVEGACVGVHELGAWTSTDALGRFCLQGVVSRWLLLALDELFDALYSKDPTWPEAWLRRAFADGCLPPTYEPLLQSSGIGAVLNRDIFISMLAGSLTQTDLLRRLFASVARSQIIVLNCLKESLAPISMSVDVVQQLSSVTVLRISMPIVMASAIVDPLAGGSVVDEATGASVSLLPGTSLVQADGSLYHGAVTLSLSVIDASDQRSLESMPGDFSARTVDGRVAQIESFGALWVGLSGTSGAQLQLTEASPGMELSLLSDVAVDFLKLGVPPTIWEFDEVTGKWVQDDVGTLAVDGVSLPQAGVDPFSVGPARAVGAAGTAPKARGKAKGKIGKGGDEYHQLNHYDFMEGSPVWTPEAYANFFGIKGKRTFQMQNVKRAGYWNCDAIYITSFVCGRLVDAEGAAITKANVWCVGKNYAGASPRSGVDEDGNFSILAQCSSQVEVYAILPGDASMSRFKLVTCQTGPPGQSWNIGELKLTEDRRSNTPRAEA